MKRLPLLLIPLLLFADSNGKQTVSTSGTPVQLAVASPPIKCTIVTVQAKSTNTGTIWFGFGSTVSAANSLGVALGPPITAGQPGGTYSLYPVANTATWTLSDIWLDATVSGDGVTYTCR